LVVLAYSLSATLHAQGVKMSADFIPLEVGNRWVYEVVNESGQKIGDLDFSIQEHTIISGRSFYVLTRFPFVEGGNLTKLIRYDRQERQYLKMMDSEEGPLFLADGTTAEVLQSDQSGLPLKFVLRMDLMDLTFQRGIGIIEAHIRGANGLQIARLASVHVGERRAAEAAAQGAPVLPQPKTLEQKTKELAQNVAAVSDENPVLDVRATGTPEGHTFTLTVINTSDKLLPFRFRSGQTYDFAVIDAQTGQEVWRWSRRMFFPSQVIRQEAIRPNKNWSFEITWNHRDNDLNTVTPGSYKVIGIVATEPPIESDPATFEIK